MVVMKTLREALLLVLLAMLVLIGFEAVQTLRAFRASMEGLESTVGALPAIIDKQTSELRSDIRYEVQLARIDLVRQVDLARTELAEDVAASGEALERHAAIIDAQLLAAGATIERATETFQTVNDTTARVSMTLQRFDETSDLLLDCESNPQCFANRFIGTTQAIERFAQSGERAMRAVDQAMPKVMADVEASTAASVRASESTAGLMANLEKQSKPLPLMLRFAPQAVQAILLGIGVIK